MNTSHFAQGTTAPQDFQLLVLDANGDSTPFDATGGSGGVSPVFTVSLVLTSATTGATINTVGDVAWLTPLEGIVRYSPDSTDLTAAASPFNVRWKVEDANGLAAFFPDGIADRWVVRL